MAAKAPGQIAANWFLRLSGFESDRVVCNCLACLGNCLFCILKGACMRIDKLSGSFLLLALLWVLLFAPGKVQAVTLTPLLVYEGLTIEQPLTLSSDPQKDITMSLFFGEQKEIAMTTPTEPEVLVETIVVPTVSAETTEIEDVLNDRPVPAPSKAQKSIAPLKLTPIPSTITKTPTAIPTLLTPTAIPQPSASTPVQLSNGGLDADKLFAMTNTYRQSKGLPPFQKDDRACQLAVSRAPEIAAEIAEDRMHSGLKARNLPYWNTENIITMRTEEDAFNWWINDTIHREQIEGNFTYSCTACSGNACAQEFTNFQPK